jgi:hypothetical protein
MQQLANLLGDEGVSFGDPRGRRQGDVVVPLLVMAGFGVAFTVMAAAKFRLEDAKAYYG